MLICILLIRNWRNEQRERNGESVACLLQIFLWVKHRPYMLCVLVCLEYDYMTTCQWLWLLCEHLICMLWYNTWYMDIKWYVWLHDRTCEIWYLGLIAQCCYTWYVYSAYVVVHDITWWHDAISLIYKRYMNKRYEHE